MLMSIRRLRITRCLSGLGNMADYEAINRTDGNTAGGSSRRPIALPVLVGLAIGAAIAGIILAVNAKSEVRSKNEVFR